MIKRLFSFFVSGLSVVALILLSGCQLKPTQPPLQESFDTDPQTVILYLDIRYPGIPMPTKINGIQECIPYPVFRVWGDNFALLNADSSRIERDQIYTGFLSAATRTALYDQLIKNQFFSLPESGPVSPAGDGMVMGVKLKNWRIFERGGYLGSFKYSPYIDLIKPEVTPVSSQAVPDARVEAFFTQYSDCPRY